MRFWRIQRPPQYDSDYKHTYVNGSLEHPFGLSGVKCDVCGATWGGSRVLPSECPESLRHHKNITDRWPVSRAEHEALQKELMGYLAVQGHPFDVLRPGDDFQPCFLDVPSRPRADFLWSSLGSLVVSERIKDVLVNSCSSEIAICPVTIRKIGNREAKLPPPVPSTGEPEDMFDEVPIVEGASKVGPYFEVLVLNESGYPPGGTPTKVCAGCRRPDIDSPARQIRMTPEMWKGHHIFFIATTLYVVITDELRKQLVRYRPTNVLFEEM